MPDADVRRRFGLRASTRRAWVDAVLANPTATLVDHAHCEMKAATTALMMAARYAAFPAVADAMLALARQEISHYEDVVAELRRRGAAPEPHGADAYAKALRGCVVSDEPARLVDLSPVSAIVEARSRERFELLANAVEDPVLRDLWAEFAACEAGHHALFLTLAENLAGQAVALSRMESLLDAEAVIVEALPCEARIHG
jgi:tRNA-(ms[2]io[6]A)-hydroxylase